MEPELIALTKDAGPVVVALAMILWFLKPLRAALIARLERGGADDE